MEKTHLVRRGPDLLEYIDVTTKLLMCLEAQGALPRSVKQQLQSLGTNDEKVQRLLEHVGRDVKGRYQALVDALTQDGQTRPADILSSVYHQSAGAASQPDRTWVDMLIEENKHFSHKLNIFKNCRDYSEGIVNLAQLYTNLRLVAGQDSSDQSIGILDFSLEYALSQGTQTVIFQSVPGAGKSCSLLHIANSWGEAISNNKEIPFEILKGVRNLVYIRPEDCRKRLHETVDAIFDVRCGEQSHLAKAHYEEHPTETAIVYDSLDETATNDELISDLKDEMKLKKRIIIAGARTHHPVLDDIAHVPYIRRVEVQGFDKPKIMDFVTKYFTSDKQHADGSPEKRINGIRYAIQDDQRLYGLLTIPLVLVLLCILIKAGKVAADKLRGLTRLMIYEELEKLVCDRDSLKPSEGMLKAFYKVCFVSLFEDRTCYINEMEDNKIDLKNVPFVLLGKKTLIDSDKGNCIVWPHQSFLEYSAAKYLNGCAESKIDRILCFVSSKRKLNNTLMFLMEMLGAQQKRVILITNAILALQVTFHKPWHWPVSLSCLCRERRNKRFLRNISHRSLREIMGLRETFTFRARKPFKACRQCWERTNYASTLEGQAALSNAFNCLHLANTAEERKIIYKCTIARISQLGKEGVTIIVPKTERVIKIEEPTPHHISMKAHQSVDLIQAKAFTTLTNKVIAEITLEVDQGEETSEHTTPAEWVQVIKEFVKNSSALHDCRLVISSPLKVTNDAFILAVLECHQKLSDHGVNLVAVGNGNVSLFKDREWKIKNMEITALSLQSPGGKLTFKIGLDAEPLGTKVKFSWQDGTPEMVAQRISDLNLECAGACLHLLDQHVRLIIWHHDGLFLDENSCSMTEDWKKATNYLASCGSPGQLSIDISTSLAKQQTITLNQHLHQLNILHELKHDDIRSLHTELLSEGWTVTGGGEKSTLTMMSPDSDSKISIRYNKKAYLGVPDTPHVVCIEEKGQRCIAIQYSHPADLTASGATYLSCDRQLEVLWLSLRQHDDTDTSTGTGTADEHAQMVNSLPIALAGEGRLVFTYFPRDTSIATIIGSIVQHLDSWGSHGVRLIEVMFGAVSASELLRIYPTITAAWHTSLGCDEYLGKTFMVAQGDGGMVVKLQLSYVTISYSSEQELRQVQNLIETTGLCWEPKYKSSV